MAKRRSRSTRFPKRRKRLEETRLSPVGSMLLARLEAAEARYLQAERERLVAEAAEQARFTVNRLLEEIDRAGPDDPMVVVYSDEEKPDELTTMELDAIGRLLGTSFRAAAFVKRTDVDQMRLESPGYVFQVTRGELFELLKRGLPS